MISCRRILEPAGRRQAFALLIVLSCLVLLSALVVAFLVQVSTELKSSKLSADASSARLLASSAINIVQSQIADATRGVDGSKTLAWASQPGMIRTYDDTGSISQYFKLYSDAEMVVPKNAFNAATTSTALAGWDTNKALYVDLNEPAYLNGTANYPIVDGNNLSPLASANIPAGAKTYNMDSDPNTPDIDGFYVKDAPVASSDIPNPVPMPVSWLYVLANGEIVAPVPSSSGKPNTVTIPGADQIVGRIAFWTDDETCKVNINTASEGTYSDYPRVNYGPTNTNSWDELTLANNQPVNGEFQRYPGHPAMTSLSTILKKPSTGYTDQQWSEELYKILPRIVEGGSAEGTVLTAKSAGAGILPLSPDADRLYATIDELALNPARSPNNLSVLTKGFLGRAKFFLTTGSRAPDVNLFNQPRVGIWPISVVDSPDYRSPFEALIAFCSTINHQIYYFQREDSSSGTHDLPDNPGDTGLARNRTVLEYLRALTDQNIPGFGGSFANKYSTSNGASGTDRDQILTEIFDYIRATNLSDSAVTNKYTQAIKVGSNTWTSGSGQVTPIVDSKTTTKGFGRFYSIRGASLLFIANADGDLPATQPRPNPDPTQPSNQVPSGKLRIQAILLPQLFDPAVGVVSNSPNFTVVLRDLDKLKWRTDTGSFSMFSQSELTLTQNGYPKDGGSSSDQYGLAQIATQTLVTTSIDMPKGPGTFSFEGGDITIEIQTPKGDRVQTAVLSFPAASLPLPSLAPSNVCNYNWDDSFLSGPYNMRYFDTPPPLAMPNVLIAGELPGNNSTSKGRFSSEFWGNAGAWITDYDVIRSVTVPHGDTRLIAAQTTPPSSSFAPLGDYFGLTKVMGMHNWWTGLSAPYYGAVGGRLVAGEGYDGWNASGYTKTDNFLKYASKAAYTKGPGGTRNMFSSSGSDVPFDGVAVGKATAISGNETPGDFDNAPGLCRDGAYINKPDEGDMGGYIASAKLYYTPYLSWRGRTGTRVLTTGLFTPNRQIPSAVNFGSLPTGVFANRPWQTLLFHPDPTGNHPGRKDKNGDGGALSPAPADHLLLDLFHMPVVEPYAISEPLSTAGRVNMNYQIIPFTYINRSTGINSILKSERVIAIANNQAFDYKQSSQTTLSPRYAIDVAQTLTGFTNRFDANDIFRSASEICELPIVPSDPYSTLDTYNTMGSYWNSPTTAAVKKVPGPTDGHRLTGDNSKERPYATIYPRLTTKSNTFTVYVRAQSLKKSKGGKTDQWVEGVDRVTGEYRGSETIERYVDPNSSLPDYAKLYQNNPPISRYYKMRVLTAKQFAP